MWSIVDIVTNNIAQKCHTNNKQAYHQLHNIVKIKTNPKESTIFAKATDMCILVLFDTTRDSLSCDFTPAVAAATNISLRTPV